MRQLKYARVKYNNRFQAGQPGGTTLPQGIETAPVARSYEEMEDQLKGMLQEPKMDIQTYDQHSTIRQRQTVEMSEQAAVPLNSDL